MSHVALLNAAMLAAAAGGTFGASQVSGVYSYPKNDEAKRQAASRKKKNKGSKKSRKRNRKRG